MNTGLHDNWNLVWKLDLAVRGYARPALIDSYNTERTPAVRSVIEMTHLMTRGLGTPNKLAQTVRDLAIPLLFRMQPFRHAMVQRLSQLGVSYSRSPIVRGAGKRYFDDSVRHGEGICSRFLLMQGNGANQTTKDAARSLCAEMSDILELRSSQGDSVKLIRPDGYVAYEASRGDGSAIGAMQSLLRVMTTDSKPTRTAERP